MRSRYTLLLVIVVGVVLPGCSLMASQQGLGSHDADLAAMNSAVDATISEANLRVRSRTPGAANVPCYDSGGHAGGTHAAAASVVVDLAGEDSEAVSRRLEEVWQRHADDWFGGGLTIGKTIPGSARVSASKGAWIIEAGVPFNEKLGPYVIDASAPCY